MSSLFNKRSHDKMVQAFQKALAEEGLGDLWDAGTEKTVTDIYQGVLSCVEDDLYLQEFMPYASMYKLAGELGVQRRNRKVPIEKVMQEHILLRDVFWDYRRSRAERVHDFAGEKRVCQCFNSILQATVQAYQTREPTLDVLDPLRDDLTGVFNELYFMTRLDEEILRSERYMRDVTVVLLHIDYMFEPGSEDEAELMRAAARVLRRNSRASDILARVEHQRFAVLMPETRSEDAVHAAERFKDKLQEYLNELGGEYASVSIETGMAAYPEHGEDSVILLEQAEDSIRREASGG